MLEHVVCEVTSESRRNHRARPARGNGVLPPNLCLTLRELSRHECSIRLDGRNLPLPKGEHRGFVLGQALPSVMTNEVTDTGCPETMLVVVRFRSEPEVPTFPSSTNVAPLVVMRNHVAVPVALAEES